MKPLLLEMQAFGPYPDMQRIDFRIIGADRLFLIHGPTGAGKTTIFDAMCFALYGTTSAMSQGARKAKDMRSDHAAQNVETLVKLTFQVGTEVYSIERKPAYLKAGNKNETEGKVVLMRLQPQNDNGVLQWQTADAPLVKLHEVKAELSRLVGLDEQQFRQVIVIPQGEFQRLLKSDTRERTEIFAKLFQAELYKHFTESLKEQSQERLAVVQTLKERVAAQCSALGVNEAGEMEAKLAAVQQMIDSAHNTLPELEKLWKHHQMEREAAGRDAEKFAAFHTAKQQLEAHKAGEIKVLEEEDRLKRSEAANALAPRIDDVRKKHSDLEAQKKERENRITQAQEAAELLKKAQSHIAKTQQHPAELEALMREQTELEALRSKVEQFSTINSTIAAVQKEADDAQKALQTVLREQKRLQKRNDELADILPKLAEHAALLDTHRKELQRLNDLKHTLSDYDIKRKNLATLEKSLVQLLSVMNTTATERTQAVAAFERTDAAWRRNQAALLALSLAPNEPCPVCGSAEHPAPAHASEGVVLNEEYDAAKARKEQAEAAAQEAKAAYDEAFNKADKLKALSETLFAQLGDSAELSQAQFLSAIQHATAKVEEAQQAGEQLRALTEEQTAVRLKVSTIEQERQTKEHHANSINTRLAELTAERNGLNVPEEYAALTALEQRLKAIATRKQILHNDVEKAREELTNATTHHGIAEAAKAEAERRTSQMHDEFEQHRSALEREAQSLGFASIKEAHKFRLTEAEAERLRTENEAWKRTLTQCEALFEQAAAQIQGLSEASLAELQSKEQIAHQAYQARREDLVRHEAEKSRLQAGRLALEALVRSLDEASNEAALVVELSDVAQSKNDHKVDFQTFVLSVMLDEVVEAANMRLRDVSQQRFELRRRAGLGDTRKRRTGLDLNIFDYHTGKERSADTLSGGETFFTSLSLALGLADVVMRRSGGVRLDAMFIDEGFGSLDAETLDLAVQTLVNLQASGRMVGIISHVGDLKERITTRLEIIKRQNGSVISDWKMG